MAQFRVGQMVKVVDGPRAGMATVICGDPVEHQCRCSDCAVWSGLGVSFGELLFPIAIPNGMAGKRTAAPARWLRPLDDGRERADLSAMPEWIRRLTKQRERA